MPIINGAFTDSFDMYNTSALLKQKWTSGNFFKFPVAGREGQGVGLPQFGNVLVEFDAGGTVVMGFAWAVGGVGNFGGQMYVGLGAGSTQFVILFLEPDYTLSVISGSQLVCNSSPFVLQVEVWNYIELNYQTGGTVGHPLNITATVNVNSRNIMTGNATVGTPTIPVGGADVLNHQFIGPNNPFAEATLDDVYIVGGSSVSPANFYGDVEILCSVPNSDDAGNTWTGSYTDIDSLTPTDSTSINTTTAGDISTFGFTPITGTPLPGLQAVCTWLRMSGAGGDQIEEIVNPGAHTSAVMFLSPPIDWYSMSWPNDPNTGLAWTAPRYNLDHWGVWYL